MNLPEWITPGALALCGPTLFAVSRMQQAKPPLKDVVLLAANEERFPLPQCQPATLMALASVGRFIDAAGTVCAVSVRGDRVTLTDLQFHVSRTIRIDGLGDATSIDAVAREFAAAFNGVIVQEVE